MLKGSSRHLHPSLKAHQGHGKDSNGGKKKKTKLHELWTNGAELSCDNVESVKALTNMLKA